jgi:hypothetical protein
MDAIDRLLEEHVHHRRLAGEMEKALGAPSAHEVGWNDCAGCDFEKFKEIHRELKELVLDHERREERLLHEALGLLEGGAEAVRVLEKRHGNVKDLLRLLESVASLYDGAHLHPLRTVAARVREELESHHEFEEKELFPRLKRDLHPSDMERLGRHFEEPARRA